MVLGDVANVIYQFETLLAAKEDLDDCILQLGNEGRSTSMQRNEFMNHIDETYTLLLRDYACDSSEEAAHAIRLKLHETSNTQLQSAKSVARILGYTDDRGEDSIMTPLGLRTLSRLPVIREGVADKIIDEYGSLSNVLNAVDDEPDRLGEIGVNNPDVLANSLHRMWGKSE